MRKEIAPELYNYNKFPGPEFHLHGDKVETEGIAFSLVENIKDAFDVTTFNQRFSEVLTKFDYIVGDWSNEQLRLRGFYKDDRTEEKLEKISRLQASLLECWSAVVPILSYKIKLLSEHHLTRKCVRRKKKHLLEKERNRLKLNESRMQIRKIDVVRKTSILRKRTRDNVILSFVRSE